MKFSKLSIIKKSISGAALILLSLSMTGCPGDDGGAGAIGTSPTGGHYTCNNGICPQVGEHGQTNLLASALGNSLINGSQIFAQLGLDISGDYGAGANQNFYTGPLYTIGHLYVQSQGFATCPMPIGRYEVRTTTAGEMDQNGIIRNVTVEAIGHEGAAAGHTLGLTIVDGGVRGTTIRRDLANLEYNYGLWATVEIHSFDAQPCPNSGGGFFNPNQFFFSY